MDAEENQKQVSHFPTAYDLPWMTKFRKEGLAAELRSFSRLTVRLEYAPTAGSMRREGEACLAPTRVRCRGRAAQRAPRGPKR